MQAGLTHYNKTYGIIIDVSKKEYKELHSKKLIGKASVDADLNKKNRKKITFSVSKNRKPFEVIFTPEEKDLKKIKRVDIIINKTNYNNLYKKPFVRFRSKYNGKSLLVQLEISRDPYEKIQY